MSLIRCVLLQLGSHNIKLIVKVENFSNVGGGENLAKAEFLASQFVLPYVGQKSESW